MRARVLATLSALASFVYIGGILFAVIMLFVNWRIALLVAVGLPFAAVFAHRLDRAKLVSLYGDKQGGCEHKKRWEEEKVNWKQDMKRDVISANDKARLTDGEDSAV